MLWCENAGFRHACRRKKEGIDREELKLGCIRRDTNGNMNEREEMRSGNRERRTENGELFLKTDHHRLRLQPHAPYFFHALLDLFFERNNLIRARAAAIHNRQRMPARDTHVAEAVAFGKS